MFSPTQNVYSIDKPLNLKSQLWTQEKTMLAVEPYPTAKVKYNFFLSI